jgi:IS1 family transposase
MNFLPFERQVAVISALTEGMSIRAVERLSGVHRDTIVRLGLQVGEGCDRLHDYLMRDLRVSKIELDEVWGFVRKKQRRVKPGETDAGDFYSFLALDATNKAIIAYRTGKRDGDTTEYFLADLRSRVLGSPVVSSDAFRFYERAVERTFKTRIQYGQLIKHYSGEPSREAARRYSPGVVVGVERRVIAGKMRPEDICTSHVERANLSLRMASRRFARLTNAFSKVARNHAAAVSLFVGFYNLCRIHEALRMTPAMALGVTDHVWSVAELLEGAVRGTVDPPGRRVGRLRVIDGGRN